MKERWIRERFTPSLPLGKDGQRVTASPAHIALSKEAAKEGMVLLKNDGPVLPLAKGTRIALFGKATIDYVKGGGGSGDVTVPYVRNLAEGFALLGDAVHVYQETVDFYQKEVAAQYEAGIAPGMTSEPALPAALVKEAAAYADVAIISLCRFSGEGWDRRSHLDTQKEHKLVDQALLDRSDAVFERGDFYLSNAEEAMVQAVCDAFDKIVVVLNVGGVVDSTWFAKNDKISSVLLAWQGGMEGGLAAAELLTGCGNPSGKLCDTFAAELADYPSSDGYFDSDDYVDYKEDIYVGYRYFETIPGAAVKVVYPFGYGLSYTTFEVSALSGCFPKVADGAFEGGCDAASVSAMVRNTGACPGREVVQVYVSAPQGRLGKPAKVLAGYAKTKLLAPGESQMVTIRFRMGDLASYDDLGKVQKSAYLLEAGTYQFLAGTSVRDVQPVPETFQLKETLITRQLTARMVPTQLKMRLLADGAWEPLPQGTPNDPNEDGLVHQTFDEAEGVVPAVRAVPQYHRWGHVDPRPKLQMVADGTMTLDEFIAALPDEDLAWLLGGQPNTGVANTYGYGNNVLYGIPNAMTADGPAGLRIQPEVGVKTTAFPCSTLIACTWDPETAYRVGEAGGAEVKENNISAWLTPAICIHRNPMCGRNFEYYSEDPLLTAKQAGAMVDGIQSNRVAATIKHFALNNKESNRKDSDSRCSERAIREIYLKAYELIVRDNDPWSIMTSYNIINGHRASENKDMLTGILREEWGYEGMVTTDWWTLGEHYKEAAAGNDMKMGCGYPDRLLAALEKGLITRAEMELCAKHILGLILKLE